MTFQTSKLIGQNKHEKKGFKKKNMISFKQSWFSFYRISELWWLAKKVVDCLLEYVDFI